MSTDDSVTSDSKTNNPWGIIVPMVAIVLLFIGVMLSTRYLNYFQVYPFLVLIYPLIFGTAGAVLPGHLSLTGRASEQIPWKISATAGIGAALVGFLIAYQSSTPTNCDPPAPRRYSL